MVCPKYEFCKKAQKHEKELDSEYVKLYCMSSCYEECEDLFEE